MKYSNSIVTFFALASASIVIPSSSLVAAKRDKDDDGQDLREAATVMAVDDVINLPPGTSEAFIAVLENDSGMNLAIKSISSQASSGECITSLSLNEVVYTPADTAFIGSDQCEYEACDATNMCDTATLTIVIKEDLTSGPSTTPGGTVKTVAPTPAFPEDTPVPTPGEVIETPAPTPAIPEVTPAPTPDDIVNTPFPTEKGDNTPAPVTTPVYPTPDYKPTDAPVATPVYPTPDYYKPTDAPVATPYNKPEPVPAYYHNPEPAVTYPEPEPVYQEPVYEPESPAAYEPEPYHEPEPVYEPEPYEHHNDDHYDAGTDDHYEHHDDHYEAEPYHEPEPEHEHEHDGYVTDHYEQHDDMTYYPTYQPTQSGSWSGGSDHSGSWSGSVSEGGDWSGSSGGSGKSGKSSKGSKGSKSSKGSSDGVVHRKLLRKNRVLYTNTVDDYYTASYGYSAGHIIDHFDEEKSHHHSKSGKGSGKARKLLRTSRR